MLPIAGSSAARCKTNQMEKNINNLLRIKFRNQTCPSIKEIISTQIKVSNYQIEGRLSGSRDATETKPFKKESWKQRIQLKTKKTIRIKMYPKVELFLPP